MPDWPDRERGTARLSACEVDCRRHVIYTRCPAGFCPRFDQRSRPSRMKSGQPHRDRYARLYVSFDPGSIRPRARRECSRGRQSAHLALVPGDKDTVAAFASVSDVNHSRRCGARQRHAQLRTPCRIRWTLPGCSSADWTQRRSAAWRQGMTAARREQIAAVRPALAASIPRSADHPSRADAGRGAAVPQRAPV